MYPHPALLSAVAAWVASAHAQGGVDGVMNRGPQVFSGTFGSAIAPAADGAGVDVASALGQLLPSSLVAAVYSAIPRSVFNEYATNANLFASSAPDYLSALPSAAVAYLSQAANAVDTAVTTYPTMAGALGYVYPTGTSGAETGANTTAVVGTGASSTTAANATTTTTSSSSSRSTSTSTSTRSSSTSTATTMATTTTASTILATTTTAAAGVSSVSGSSAAASASSTKTSNPGSRPTGAVAAGVAGVVGMFGVAVLL
ncbi:MAG: hypothetical protein M1826_004067 [Phylliscum demangeonii]|nr:MAG: hypothetical protein M1826_004067 [Phylliscum demangeonii]